MELILLVMEIVALACVSALCLYLVSLIIRLRTTLAGVEQDLKELTSKAIPVFENLEVITEKVKNVTENIDEQVELAKNSIRSIKSVADNILDFERKIQDRIEEPVLESITVFAGFVRGVQTFFNRLRA